MFEKRYLEASVSDDLENGKMVFLGGPRQVGKTTFAFRLLGKKSNEKHPAYMNWDAPGVAKALRAGHLPPKQPLLVLDEIHKAGHWRNLVKGLYDTNKSDRRFLVTGSARLDHFRKGGDSLLGRYHHYRLHPFSWNELGLSRPSDLEGLLKFGGFPDPYLRRNERFWRRWQKERLTRVTREDLVDLERVKDLSLVQLLAETLPSKVGSPLSVQSLREDLQVDHKTAERWITILENLYYCFRIPPFGSSKIRAVKKEQKLYMWDWSLVEDPGARFENLVASQLLKYCHFLEDTEGYRMELRYLRDTDKRETDFIVLRERKPLFAVECKLENRGLDPSLAYFKARVPVPRWFQVHAQGKSYEKDGIRAMHFQDFCTELALP